MLSGGIDVMVEVPPDDLALFEEDAAFTVHQQAGPHLWFLILNTRTGPLADRRVRQAVNYAIAKEVLGENVVRGTAEVAAGAVPPAFARAYDDHFRPSPPSPRRVPPRTRHGGRLGTRVRVPCNPGGSRSLK